MDPNRTTPSFSHDSHAPLQFEDPTVGGRNVPPRYWADKARRCEWPRGRRRARTPGTLLHNLQQLPLEREPTVNDRIRLGLNQCHNGENFWNLLGQKKSNIEAISAQSTGVLFDGELACANCARGAGIFDGCVQVPGQMQCANCHFGDQGWRCSFHETYSNSALAQAIAQRDIIHQQMELLDQQRELVERQILEIQARGCITQRNGHIILKLR